MSEQNVVGIPYKDPESFFKLRAMIGGIYDSMNRDNQPNTSNNHVGSFLDPALADFMNSPSSPSNSFFGK